MHRCHVPAWLLLAGALALAPRTLAAQHLQPATEPSGEAVAQGVPEAMGHVAVSAALAAQSAPSPVPRILVESLFASVGTLMGTFMGGFTAALASGEPEANAIGVTVGGSLVGALGTWTAGYLFGTSGSFWTSWGASLLGYGIGLGIVWAATGGAPGDDATLAAIVAGGTLGTLGAVVGYELTVPPSQPLATNGAPRHLAATRIVPWYDGHGGGMWVSVTL